MTISRSSVVEGLALTVGAAALGRSALAGPVTTDEIGDQVQTLPRGQLPDFAGPGTPGIRALYQAGKPLREIRAAIDGKYGRKGPATPTQMPPG